MTSKRRKDWYEHLVDQSATDHIYSLIHGYLPHDWADDPDYDMVALRTGDLPDKLKPVPAEHISKRLAKENYCFPTGDYLLLDDWHLTEYLEAARRMAIVEDLEGREFMELLFTDDPNEYSSYEDDNEKSPARKIPDYRTTSPSMLENPEDAIAIAYELLRTAKEREIAYEYAKVAEAFLDSRQVTISDNSLERDLYEVTRAMLGYNVVAMVYTWNNKIDDAARVDSHYLLYPNVWDALKSYIVPYLEMLIAKKQGDYLQFLFQDAAFREKFLAHYEAFISILVNDRYELSQKDIHEVVAIINRINNAHSVYS